MRSRYFILIIWTFYFANVYSQKRNSWYIFSSYGIMVPKQDFEHINGVKDNQPSRIFYDVTWRSERAYNIALGAGIDRALKRRKDAKEFFSIIGEINYMVTRQTISYRGEYFNGGVALRYFLGTGRQNMIGQNVGLNTGLAFNYLAFSSHQIILYSKLSGLLNFYNHVVIEEDPDLNCNCRAVNSRFGTDDASILFSYIIGIKTFFNVKGIVVGPHIEYLAPVYPLYSFSFIGYRTIPFYYNFSTGLTIKIGKHDIQKKL